MNCSFLSLVPSFAFEARAWRRSQIMTEAASATSAHIYANWRKLPLQSLFISMLIVQLLWNIYTNIFMLSSLLCLFCHRRQCSVVWQCTALLASFIPFKYFSTCYSLVTASTAAAAFVSGGQPELFLPVSVMSVFSASESYQLLYAIILWCMHVSVVAFVYRIISVYNFAIITYFIVFPCLLSPWLTLVLNSIV